MNNYLSRLIARERGEAPILRPTIAPLFAPGPELPSDGDARSADAHSDETELPSFPKRSPGRTGLARQRSQDPLPSWSAASTTGAAEQAPEPIAETALAPSIQPQPPPHVTGAPPMPRSSSSAEMEPLRPAKTLVSEGQTLESAAGRLAEPVARLHLFAQTDVLEQLDPRGRPTPQLTQTAESSAHLTLAPPHTTLSADASSSGTRQMPAPERLHHLGPAPKSEGNLDPTRPNSRPADLERAAEITLAPQTPNSPPRRTSGTPILAELAAFAVGASPTDSGGESLAQPPLSGAFPPALRDEEVARLRDLRSALDVRALDEVWPPLPTARDRSAGQSQPPTLRRTEAAPSASMRPAKVAAAVTPELSMSLADLRAVTRALGTHPQSGEAALPLQEPTEQLLTALPPPSAPAISSSPTPAERTSAKRDSAIPMRPASPQGAEAELAAISQVARHMANQVIDATRSPTDMASGSAARLGASVPTISAGAATAVAAVQPPAEVHVHIGRLEVRGTPPRVSESLPTPTRSPVLSLQNYLKGLRGRR